MSEPVLPTPLLPLPETSGPSNSGEGAQTALAAMIRKRKMVENHIDDEPPEAAGRPAPGP